MASSDVKALTVSDENAADADRLVTAARPDTSATMAQTTHAGGAARNVTVTTTGTGDNSKTCTITGTDVFGDAMTEVITSTSSAETVAGEKLFLTVSAVECSAKYAANITVGSGTLCAQAIGDGGRIRLKGLSVVSAHIPVQLFVNLKTKTYTIMEYHPSYNSACVLSFGDDWKSIGSKSY